MTDGDTIRVRKDNREEQIRLCGIDAPEVAHDSQPGQPLGEQSKAYLQQLLTRQLNRVHHRKRSSKIQKTQIMDARSLSIEVQTYLRQQAIHLHQQGKSFVEIGIVLGIHRNTAAK
jgi:Staphylococcal nuclease homologue